MIGLFLETLMNGLRLAGMFAMIAAVSAAGAAYGFATVCRALRWAPVNVTIHVHADGRIQFGEKDA